MTAITMKIEVDLDVPLNIFGMWITHQLNYGPRGPFQDYPPEVESHLDALDGYHDIVKVDWGEPFKEWTKKPPTEAGYYWADIDGNGLSVVKVVNSEGVLMVQFMGYEVDESLDKLVRERKCQWRGPITPPVRQQKIVSADNHEWLLDHP